MRSWIIARRARFRRLAGTTLLAPLLLATPGARAQDPHLETARRVLRAVPLIDGHNDLPWYIRTDFRDAPRNVDAYDLRRAAPGNTDIARLRRGMVGGQFWSVYIPGDVRDSGYARMQLEQIDIARQVLAKYPDVFAPALTAADLRAAHRAGRIGSMLGMEGGHAIENSLGALRAYFALGVRYMTLTHNVTLDWADAAADSARHGGLTNFGKEVVREMNRLGMLVDLSHVSPAVMSDALTVSEAPVIFSHSSARALTDVPRNVPDSILERLPRNGGVVMVTFVPSFVSQELADRSVARSRTQRDAERRHGADTAAVTRTMASWDAANPAPRATLQQVADHIDHVRKVAGVDHVGIGSDFDGTGNDLPVGLEDVSTFPVLLAELSRRGWNEADLGKLAGENVLRVLTRAEEVARRLQRDRRPSTRTIEELDGPRRR
ncbi:MAG TPA: dipeptidase [Gemmatimonadaceae bacterium]|nr:dipeptidase [Gemmatimonadaceae bacterium]